MNFRTDLTLERREILGIGEISGVTSKEFTVACAKVTEIEITTEAGAETIGKPVGKYITIEVPEFAKNAEILDGRLEAITTPLRALLPKEGAILVAGLGNTDITPDALGPKCAQKIFATRHISESLAETLGLRKLRPVAALTPGVLGKTGIEPAEIIAGTAQKTNPAAVIIIDALAARQLSRLGNTIQMCDTGISPGSGVGNRRAEISQATLGIPVIAVGVPTVVDAVTIACEVFGEEENANEYRRKFDEKYSKMMVTPREIDLVTERAAKLVALAINCALQPTLTPEDLLELTL